MRTAFRRVTPSSRSVVRRGPHFGQTRTRTTIPRSNCAVSRTVIFERHAGQVMVSSPAGFAGVGAAADGARPSAAGPLPESRSQRLERRRGPSSGVPPRRRHPRPISRRSRAKPKRSKRPSSRPQAGASEARSNPPGRNRSPRQKCSGGSSCYRQVTDTPCRPHPRMPEATSGKRPSCRVLPTGVGERRPPVTAF